MRSIPRRISASRTAPCGGLDGGLRSSAMERLGRGTLDGRRRVVIVRVVPSVEGGRHPVKRTLGDRVDVAADLLVGGHDRLAAWLHVTRPDGVPVEPRSMAPAGPHALDRVVAEVELDALGAWSFSVEAWVDDFATWRHGVERKAGAGQDIAVELLGGARLVADAAARAVGDAAAALRPVAARLADPTIDPDARLAAALDDDLAAAMARVPDRSRSTTSAPHPAI